MDSNRSVALNRSQLLHERVMRAVVRRMQDTPYVLKGGTALAFAYDLDRHSTDLDFDAAEPIYIKRRVREGLADAGARMSAWIISKDSWQGQRFKVHYMEPRGSEDHLLKVDVSFRVVPKEADVTIVRGIRTYRIGALIDQKLNAGQSRTAARDLYDLGFLAERNGDAFSDDQIRRSEAFSRDFELLAEEYEPAFSDDKILSKIATAEDRVLAFRIAVLDQMEDRGLGRIGEVEQAMPEGKTLAEALAAHKAWRDTNGRRGQRAVLRDFDFTGRSLCGLNLDRVILIRPNFTGADLRDSTLRGAVLRNPVFDGTDLTGVDATGIEIRGITMRKTRMGPTTLGIAEALAEEHRRVHPMQSFSYTPQRVPARDRDYGPSR